jgi:predicted ATP-dependent endonuclease of OLD family
VKIRQLKLRKFRCFGSKETTIDFEDLTTFIGINSSGKTAVLHALVKLFGRSASSRELRRADFHVPKGKRPEELGEQNLSIEAIVDFPELNSDDDTAKNTVPLFFRHMTVGAPEETPYCRIRLEADWRKGNTPEGDIDQRHVFITVPEDSEGENPDDHKRPLSAHHRSMIEIIYVPAIRDPSSQLRNAAGTILWRVLSGIIWPEGINGQIKDAGEALERILGRVSGFSKLEEIMGEQWRNLHSDIRYNQVKVSPSNDDLNAVLRRLDVRFFPTEVPGSYDIDALGEGLRSLFYLSLVSSLLEVEAEAAKERQNSERSSARSTSESELSRLFSPDFAPPALTVLAVEEPENHIAPHLLGRVMENLHQVAAQSNAQVVVTSHTPAIVRRVEPESIRHLRICKEKLCSIQNTIRLPDEAGEAYKYVKEAVRAYPEIYFARLVILGEGDTEEIIIPKALKLLGSSLDASGICVVPLGGRFVSHFWKLLTQLDIPHITLLDLDLGRYSGGWTRVKYIIDQLMENGFDADHILGTLRRHNISVSKEDLTTLEKRQADRDTINRWLDILEGYDVFFVRPLDMDFMMLEAFEDAYRTVAPERGGPQVPDKELQPKEYNKKLADAVKATLKSRTADDGQYGQSERLLMIWYVYLFLNRGKPSTHILALSGVDDKQYKQRLPQLIKRLLRRVREKLADDPFSQLSITEMK